MALWALVAAFDIAKAVHMDDTAHLQIAQGILARPLHPMSGIVNWEKTAQPVHTLNQPHLLFYLAAAVMWLFPLHQELALHLVWVGLSGGVVLLFFAFARRLQVSRPLGWTAAFCLGPAFLPGQNLMLDVPLAGFWLLFFFVLTGSGTTGDYSRQAGAALISGLACLVKYSSLVLVPVGIAVSAIRRHKGTWLHLAVPLALLAAWSLFNWYDYRGIHLLERPVLAEAPQGMVYRFLRLLVRALLWVIAVGAVMPLSLAWVPGLLRSPAGRRGLAVCAASGALCTLVGTFALGPEPTLKSVLRGLFLGNGLLGMGLALATLRKGLQRRRVTQATWWEGAGREILLSLWLFGAMAFVVALSPFIAVRHVLLALPALLGLLALGPEGAMPGSTARRLGLAVTVVLGLGLGLSDWAFADAYRQKAKPIHAQYCRPGQRCVAFGHWGWQWYAQEAGFEVFDEAKTRLGQGDIVVVPELLGSRAMRASIAERSSLISTIVIPAKAWTYLRTMSVEENTTVQNGRSGGYYYFWTSLPWTLTRRPLERFHIYSVTQPWP